MSAPDSAKIQKFRRASSPGMDRRQDVAAWRKWHAQIAAFTHGATEAILEAAFLRHASSRLQRIDARAEMRRRVTAADGHCDTIDRPTWPIEIRGDDSGRKHYGP